jgi:hypothetical protein
MTQPQSRWTEVNRPENAPLRPITAGTNLESR